MTTLSNLTTFCRNAQKELVDLFWLVSLLSDEGAK